MMIDLVKSPMLVAIWLGPVVWIGVAVLKEEQRIFFMRCLWTLSGNKYWQLPTILLGAAVWRIVDFRGLIMGFSAANSEEFGHRSYCMPCMVACKSSCLYVRFHSDANLMTLENEDPGVFTHWLPFTLKHLNQSMRCSLLFFTIILSYAQGSSILETW